MNLYSCVHFCNHIVWFIDVQWLALLQNPDKTLQNELLLI